MNESEGGVYGRWRAPDGDTKMQLPPLQLEQMFRNGWKS